MEVFSVNISIDIDFIGRYIISIYQSKRLLLWNSRTAAILQTGASGRIVKATALLTREGINEESDERNKKQCYITVNLRVANESSIITHLICKKSGATSSRRSSARWGGHTAHWKVVTDVCKMNSKVLGNHLYTSLGSSQPILRYIYQSTLSLVK